MANKHKLEGLIKWSMRDRWADRFEQVLEDHLMPTGEETGLEINDVVAAIGEVDRMVDAIADLSVAEEAARTTAAYWLGLADGLQPPPVLGSFHSSQVWTPRGA